MAEQKNSPPSEKDRQIYLDCERVVLDMIQYVENLDNEGQKEGCMEKKCAEHYGCGATGSCKTDDPNDSAVPIVEVKKCGEQPIGQDKMLLPETSEKCVDGLQSLSISMKCASLQKRENKKKFLEEMMREYPQMVAYQANEDDLGDFGADFNICCTECPASFSDLKLAQQHFEDNVHDKQG